MPPNAFLSFSFPFLIIKVTIPIIVADKNITIGKIGSFSEVRN
jgi:hypothetical protein